jgi:multiple sugar transport system substrate-binding protein
MGVRRFAFAALIALSVAAAGCGSSSNDAGGGGSDGAKSTNKAPTLADAKAAKGNITICAGKDTAGDQKDLIASFDAAHPGLHARLLEFPTDAGEQRTQFVQRQEAKSSECDVFKADTVFIAEFVAQNWLVDLSDYVAQRKAEFIPSTLATVNVGGRSYGVPFDTDAALLFYRTDRVRTPPTTWQDLYAQARDDGGLVYQGASYEGLTCDFLELAFAAGGQVLSPDGKKSAINSPQNLKALQFMVDGLRSGAATKANTTYMEEESRRAFESGKPGFMRNWPYAYALGNLKGSKVKDKFKVAPLPSFEGGGAASILGGKDYVISRFSKNQAGALSFIDYATQADQDARRAEKFALVPVIASVYDDPAVKKALPFSDELKQAVIQAKVRPVSPVYPQISEAIYKNVNAALSGQKSPQDALKQADDQISRALSTF